MLNLSLRGKATDVLLIIMLRVTLSGCMINNSSNDCCAVNLQIAEDILITGQAMFSCNSGHCQLENRLYSFASPKKKKAFLLEICK